MRYSLSLTLVIRRRRSLKQKYCWYISYSLLVCFDLYIRLPSILKTYYLLELLKGFWEENNFIYKIWLIFAKFYIDVTKTVPETSIDLWNDHTCFKTDTIMKNKVFKEIDVQERYVMKWA